MEKKRIGRYRLSDVVDEAWLDQKTEDIRSSLAWENPFLGWPLVLAVCVISVTYMTARLMSWPISVVYASGVFSLALAILAYKLAKKRTARSKTFNREQQLLLLEYKAILEKELKKNNITQVTRRSTIEILNKAEALLEIVRNKFTDNVAELPLPDKEPPADPMDDPHFLQHDIVNGKSDHRIKA